MCHYKLKVIFFILPITTLCVQVLCSGALEQGVIGGVVDPCCFSQLGLVFMCSASTQLILSRNLSVYFLNCRQLVSKRGRENATDYTKSSS